MDARAVGVGTLVDRNGAVSNMSRPSSQSKRRDFHTDKTENFFWCRELDFVGEGVTSSVFRCREKKTGDVFVAKVFKQAPPKREIDVLKRIDHANIVKFIALEDVCHTEKPQTALILEYCDEKCLHDYLKQPENWLGLSDLDFLQLVHNVCEGLAHIHEQKLIHRDIKPGNILRAWSRQGDRPCIVYKLGDFGSSREVLDDEECQSMVGTYEYLHPKIYDAVVHRHQTPQRLRYHTEADLWSLGVTFYQSASGRPPFRPFHSFRDDHHSTLKMIQEKPVGAISGQQDEEEGPVSWSEELPADSRLSPAVAAWITEILRGVLISSPEQQWKSEQFYGAVFKNKNCHPVSFFLASGHQPPDLAFCFKRSVDCLLDSLAEATGVARDCLLLYHNNRKLEAFPEDSSRENPVLVFDSSKMFDFSSVISDFAPDCLKLKKLSLNPDQCSLRAGKDFIEDCLRLLISAKRLSDDWALVGGLLDRCMLVILSRVESKIEAKFSEVKGKKALFGACEESLRSWQDLNCLLGAQVPSGGRRSEDKWSDVENFGQQIREMNSCAYDYHQDLIQADKLRCKYSEMKSKAHLPHSNKPCPLATILKQVESLHGVHSQAFDTMRRYQAKGQSFVSLEHYVRRTFNTDFTRLERCVSGAREALIGCCLETLMQRAGVYERWLHSAEEVHHSLIGLDTFICSVEEMHDELKDKTVQLKKSVQTELRRYFEQRNLRRTSQFSLFTSAVQNLLATSKSVHEEFSKNQRLLQQLDEMSLKNASRASALLGSAEHSPNESESQIAG